MYLFYSQDTSTLKCDREFFPWSRLDRKNRKIANLSFFYSSPASECRKRTMVSEQAVQVIASGWVLHRLIATLCDINWFQLKWAQAITLLLIFEGIFEFMATEKSVCARSICCSIFNMCCSRRRCTNYANAVCMKHKIRWPLTFMMCAMAFTIYYHLCLAMHSMRSVHASFRMKWTICVRRWCVCVCMAVASCSVRLYVCFNYKSLFIAATATRVWRRHDARIIVFDAIFSSAFTFFFVACALACVCFCVLCRHDLLVYGFFALPFAITAAAVVVYTFIFTLIRVQQSTDSCPFYSIAGCSFTRRRHVFSLVDPLCIFFCSRIFLLFGICLA